MQVLSDGVCHGQQQLVVDILTNVEVDGTICDGLLHTITAACFSMRSLFGLRSCADLLELKNMNELSFFEAPASGLQTPQ